ADLTDQGLEPANLQIVLYRLYRDAVAQGLWNEATKHGAGLTLARYGVLGGTREMLSGYLDEVISALDSDEAQRRAQVILKNMVTAQRTKAALTGREIARGQLAAQAGLDETELDALLAYLRARRVVRKFGDEDRYELAHEVLVEKVLAWISDEELRVLDVRDMLRRELSNYKKFGYLLPKERLELVEACCEVLTLEVDEFEMLFRSALAAGYKAEYWFRRAQAESVDVKTIARAGLQSENFRTRVAAVQTLGQLGDVFMEDLIDMLDDLYPQVRVAAIAALEHMRPDGVWRAHLKYECYVPAGKFIMGDDKSDQSNEKPSHEVYLDAYYIGKYLVTNAEYARYREAVGQPFTVPEGKENYPVVSISWYDARDYAAWAGMRLLSEAEWEKAASWEGIGAITRDRQKEQKRQYPWGDQFDKTRCNTDESGISRTTPVRRYSARGISPYGCIDMAGNVWEWTSSIYKSYPYRADDGREEMTSGDIRVLRGGSFYDNESAARCAYRIISYPHARNITDGMRCGVSVLPESSDLKPRG
ncbi:MAG: SUMF1/EgtB/PvdO family nonheme iron enzyme, partial [Anaerolineae bacterium]|nr:SUMF1/EgtB/PvdO family nonheme iron enzyme [Anaerolineae bacterium]